MCREYLTWPWHSCGKVILVYLLIQQSQHLMAMLLLDRRRASSTGAS